MAKLGFSLGYKQFECGIYLPDKRIQMIKDTKGKTSVPAMISFTDTQILIGTEAYEILEQNADNTIHSLLQMFGRSYYDDIIKKESKEWCFKIFPSETDDKVLVEVKIRNHDIYLLPEEILARIISTFIQISTSQYSCEINEIVMPVPVWFNSDAQRAVRNAGKQIGIKVTVISEPEAVMAAYLYNVNIPYRHLLTQTKSIVLYDWGTKDLSISVVKYKMGKVQVAGQRNIQLGGDNLDQNLVSAIVDDFNRNSGLTDNISNDPNSISIIKNECERVKIELSTHETSEINIEDLFQGLSQKTTISKTQFNKLNKPFFANSIDFMHNIIITGGLQIQHVDQCILVGGNSKIPQLEQALKCFFNFTEIVKDVDPEMVIALGACLYIPQGSDQESDPYEDISLSNDEESFDYEYPVSQKNQKNTNKKTTSTTTSERSKSSKTTLLKFRRRKYIVITCPEILLLTIFLLNIFICCQSRPDYLDQLFFILILTKIFYKTSFSKSNESQFILIFGILTVIYDVLWIFLNFDQQYFTDNDPEINIKKITLFGSYSIIFVKFILISIYGFKKIQVEEDKEEDK